MNPEVREAFNRDLEAVKSHYIFGGSEFLKQEAIKNGANFNGGNANPGSSVGGLPTASSGRQIARLSLTVVFATIIAYIQ